MSVYTALSSSQLQDFLSHFDLGELLSSSGIHDGIANSNYALTTTQGEFVLTLFESQSFRTVSAYVLVLLQLGVHHRLYPAPQADRQGQPLRWLASKPALICARIQGSAIKQASLTQCATIGEHLGRLHSLTSHIRFQQVSNQTLASIQALFAQVTPSLSAEDSALIQDELAVQQSQNTADLPSGFIHGDLFKDNVLFVGDHISGIIDFYSGGHDCLLRDVAITVNDWCCDMGLLHQDKMQALLSAYAAIRPLTIPEKHHWPLLLRSSALRFWLSRLLHQQHQPVGELTHIKNPQVFRQLLIQHRETNNV